MRVVWAQSYARKVEERKRSLGITDERIAAARNDGQRRTPEKRALIARTQARAIAAGVMPFQANF